MFRQQFHHRETTEQGAQETTVVAVVELLQLELTLRVERALRPTSLIH
jgi:hypothetical protein